LAGELVVVIGDRRAAPQREVVGGDGVDRRAQARPEDELARLDRRVEAIPVDPGRPCAEREQRRVALEVRGGTGGRRREVDPPPPVEPLAGQTVGEDLIGLQSFSISAAISAAAFFASSNSIDVLSR
jgi:hypothetical protein